LGKRSAEGREECPAVMMLPTGGAPDRSDGSGASKDHADLPRAQNWAILWAAGFSRPFLHWN